MHIHFWKLKFLIVEINKEIYQLWSRLVVCFRINCHKLIRAYDYPIFPVAICFKILLQLLISYQELCKTRQSDETELVMSYIPCFGTGSCLVAELCPKGVFSGFLCRSLLPPALHTRCWPAFIYVELCFSLRLMPIFAGKRILEWRRCHFLLNTNLM